MQLVVDPNSINAVTSFKTLFNVAADDMKAKADFETKALKLIEGKAQWKTNLTAIVLDENGVEVRSDQGISLSILNKVDLKSGVAYKLSGKVRVTPYVISGSNRQGLSIVADSVVPVASPQEGK